MNRNNIKKLTLLLVIIGIFIYSFVGIKGDLIENLDIPIAVGCDLKETTENSSDYNIPISIYLFEDSGDIISDVYTGSGKSIGETRESRQVKSNKKFLLGLERAFILGENYAKYGIRNLIDILTNNPQMNDTAYMVVCSGKAEDVLNYKIKGFASSGEFIDGLIKNSNQFNFFPEKYTTMDVIKKIDAEGKTTLLPYIEFKENKIEITGLAVFKKDKMIAKTDLEEAKIINMLKENKVKGMLTIQNSSKKYINYYAESKRKVKCYKEADKYKFIIDINLKGAIISNVLYENLNDDAKILKEFTSDMEKQVKRSCDEYINKAKCIYETDILDLGMVAAAKYGRKTGVNWNEIVCNSNIEVNVKVDVDTEGRGNYQVSKN